MASVIKITPEMIEEVKEDFFAALPTMRLLEGKIDFHRNLTEINRRAKLRFTERAWLKMTVLVSSFESEIGWHGLAHRSEEEPDTFVVDDVLIYPQKVTSTTVTPDQVEYQNWLMTQPDEIFNNIRFQGHSHVNMAVNPSSVDTAFYDEILSQLDDSMFYIFLVINKRGDKHIRIYDMANNIFYGTKDVDVEVMSEVGVEAILADAKRKVVKEVYQPPKTTANVPTAVQPTQNYAGWNNKQKNDKAEDKSSKNKTAKPFGKNYSDFDYEDPYGRYDYDGFGAYR